MNDDFLKQRLRRVIRRYQWLALGRKLAVCWAVAALVGVALVALQRATGWSSLFLLPSVAALAGVVATVLAIRHFQTAPDFRWIAQKIEAQNPELNGVLLTAVQNGLLAGREPGYFEYRVLQEATARSQERDWRMVFPTRRVVATNLVHLVALACFVAALSGLRAPKVTPGIHGVETTAWVGADGVSITPGDASVEKGDSLVVLAQFSRTLPASVALIVRENGVEPRTIPLVKSLADPVFGGSVTEVANDFTYHLEYRGQKTRDFKVTVFEHPRLVRADANLTFPDYTKLPPKRIEGTRRVGAVEGTKLDYALQLNKPVKTAKLVARDGKKTEVPLQIEAGKAVATLPGFIPQKTTTYDLQLVDAEGRANKVASPIVIDVQPNRTPEIRLTSPRGDVRPSALEEVVFDGTVFDDFGSPAYGVAYSVAGGETKFVELGRDVPAKDKRTFNHLLSLESVGVKPDDLVAWHVWADDIGPDGKVRRTSGDLYFAEVRPFDEVFRESQMPQDDQQKKGGGQQGNQRRRLTELQKQIINATWKLQRDGATPRYVEDAKVVTESQEQLLVQALEAAGEARTPRDQARWQEVTDQMAKAIEKLKDAAKEPGPLAQALPPEQAAYQGLLKLQARETNVTRGQKGGGGGGGGGQNQRQIDQLDLKQSQNRYETQRQARSPQNEERREQLAVMNRLQELSRRQQDLNERLKELQTSLQEADTEAEREEIKRRLKRLEEEQRQMIADADEIQQRMDRAQNQSNLADQRQQLDQTRQDLQRAADAAAEGSVAQALASGTRAQRQLQEMRDELRQQNSSQFAEDLREMRAEARDLAQQQDQIGQKLDGLGNTGTQRRTLSDNGDRKELGEQLDQQKERMNRLVERAQQISEQAENTEPLLSRQLYDSVRKVSQDDANAIKQARQELLTSGMLTRDLANRLQQASDRDGGGKALDVAREMLREGYLPQASQAGQRARNEIEELRRGVERAADSVLGDDAEQLKLAQSELDRLTDQLQREIAQAQQGQGRTGAAGQNQPGQQQPGGDQRQAGAQPGANGEQPGNEPGAPGQQPGEGQGQGQGQPGQRAQRLADANSQNGQPGQRGQSQPGQQPGQGQAGEQPGQQPGQGQGQGQGDASRQASADTPGQPGGPQPSTEQGNGQPGQQGQQAGGRQGGRGGRGQLANNQGRGGRGGERNGGALSVEDLMRGGGGGGGGGGQEGGFNDLRSEWLGNGPLAGADFAPWVNRLRDVEDLLEAPDLRQAVAQARERANLVRQDLNRNLKKPDWAVVQLQILKPLVEVRSRVAEELARRDSKESLAPIDRDPVPNRFAESVRRYYEELGKDKPEAAR